MTMHAFFNGGQLLALYLDATRALPI